MKTKHRVLLAIVLLIAAVDLLIYNFSMKKEILYTASIVAVCGTALILIKELLQFKNR